MSGFATTIEIRSGRPRWAVSLVLPGLLLAAVATVVADIPAWVRIALLSCLALGAGNEFRRTRRGSIAPGVAAVWLMPDGDWRLVLDTGELEKAELLHRRGFVTRGLVGLTLRRGAGAGRSNRTIRMWLTPSMLGERDWRLMQVRLRNP